MSEGFARGFFRSEESRQAFRVMTLAHGVGHFFFGVNLSREPRELALAEAIAFDLCKIDAHAEDHSAAFVAALQFSGPREAKVLPQAMDSRIRIVPINAVDGAFLDRLALCLEERFLASATIERSLAVPRSALNATRGQLFLSTLISRVRRAHPEASMLLAVTEYDLYKTSHRYIFGDADETQGIAVVSLHRLRSDYYGEEADANLLFQRTLKEAVHELGHAFGLKHCYNARCAMYYSNSIFETDNKTSYYCETCDRRISKARNER